MSDGVGGTVASSSAWPPSPFALAFDRFDHPSDSGRGSIVASHPTAPFVRTFGAAPADRDEALKRIAYDYLQALDAQLKQFGHPDGLGLPDGWLDVLDPDQPNPLFGWLPIETPVPESELRLQLSSLRLLRNKQLVPGKDTTFVLVAAETLPNDNGVRPINSDFGLQVVIHLRNDGTVAITSMTANLPFGPYITAVEFSAGVSSLPLSSFRSLKALQKKGYPDGSPPGENEGKDPDYVEPVPFFDFEDLQDFVTSKTTEIATLFQLRPDVSYDRLRFIRLMPDGDAEPLLEIEISGKGIGIENRDTFTTPYRFVAIIADVVKPVSKSALVTDAAPPGRARVFEQDPPSWRNLDGLNEQLKCYKWSARRPTRSESELDRFRRLVVIGDTDETDLETGDFAVRNCPDFARADPPNNHTKNVKLPPDVWPEVRADDHSAISAYYNCLSVFGVMRGFGIDPVPYFRATLQPFDVFYRSGISPGPGKDGQTINARVWLGPEDRRLIGSAPAFLSGERCPMSMHLALANFSHRTRWVPQDPEPNAGEPTWAEPLGIATSERWTWHEFGHAFIAGRFAQLEFPFVHSVGDALAAIAADPLSRLAEPRVPEDPHCAQADPRDRFDSFRGYTFPFVLITRRHDRCVLNGWSWGGTFHRPVIEAPEIDRGGLKGYISEQILSSTLFRLYRILGGDTLDVVNGGPDYETRMTASDVALFLIMRGIEMFGMMPAWAEELENIFVQADLSLTSPLGARTELEEAPGFTPVHSWKGGQAHKVIRWAFEAQGMYQAGPDAVANKPGKPPRVDIYIADRRPTIEKTEGGHVEHGAGGYVPVSLDWRGEPSQPDDPPLWHAGTLSDLTLPIVVKNRGREGATNVTARAWLGWADGDPNQRGWDRNTTIHWLPPLPVTPLTVAIASGSDSQATFSMPASAPSMPTGKHLFLLVEATCPDDRANSDPVAGLPCAIGSGDRPPAMPRQVADLVANDNNLGLWMQRLPGLSS